MRDRDKSIGKIPNSALFEILFGIAFTISSSLLFLLMLLEGEDVGSEAGCGSRGAGMRSLGLVTVGVASP